MSAALGLIPNMESECEERKQSWQDKECLEALAALANTRGGTLWVGVKDNGAPVEPNGWAEAGDGGKMEAITNKIVAKLGVHPASVTIETLDGKSVLAIRMNRAPAPVLLNGHYWRRVGNSSREVPAEELTRFLLERTGAKWDALPCAAGIAALDTETFEEFKALARNRLPALRPTDDLETILNNLQLRDQEGRLLRAAVLLFGRDNEAQRLAPAAFVQIGRFKGGAIILDEKQITGNLFAQLNGVMAQLRQYLQVRYDFPANEGEREGIATLQPVEIWEYPQNRTARSVGERSPASGLQRYWPRDDPRL
jgi:ATP-dependent DNA helicase RecG